ncbi:NAD(P)H-binding protein [Pelagicoccus mobilis]|uniref:NAD(P)H-binding protein n=1 Tax=Pelagicoccus mobilis TaxID=415221 RepID=A0A934S0N8_9BACT|nr:NAD(P)H-binding protein [Pelagicoccus mobilis]MBK1877299.1 NAD(P)H-binding protein [Pelagicoccus mobilis]
MLRIAIYGATGMLGQAALREAVHASDVGEILCVGRRPTESDSPKVRSLVLPDLFDHSSITGQLKDLDACFFCLGTTAAGKSEERYHRITYELTMKVAELLQSQNPNLSFIYVSAQGADSSEQGRVMWARVRGKLENQLFGMSFRSVHALRPGYIQPMDGIKSRTPLYRIIYNIVGFTYPILKKLFPNSITSTHQMGKAMLNLARKHPAPQILHPVDINRSAEE